MATIVHTRMSKLYAGPRSISGSFGATPAQSAVNAFLSQTSCVLSADVNGLVENYDPAATTIVVEVAGRVDTDNWTISTAKSESVGTVTVSGASVSVAAMSDDAGWVDITASRPGYASITRRFTLAKVRQKGGVRTVTALPLNPAAVSGELAVFLDTADQAVRGLYGWSGSAWVRTSDLLNGSVTADKLAAGAIEATKFANGIEPVSIVSLLPAVTGYSGTKLVYLTTDNKIYRFTGSAWEKGTPTADLVGTVSADQIAANAVTTGKIQAGAVSTDQLAANAVTATKMVLTDTSNVYPDYDILDPAFYGGGAFTRVASSSTNRGAYVLRIAANASEVRVTSGWFQVEPSADYFVEISAYQSVAGTTGAAAAYVELGSFTGGTNAPTVTRSELILRRVSTTSSARADVAITTAATERRARLVFVREAGGTGVADFGGPVIRRRNNAKLIVDGSIVADKLATNAVEARHILAGAVTAEKVSVNKLSAISADLGDVTAGTFTLSNTGYIRGGATSFLTGAGFWMGYDSGTYKLRAGIPGSSGFEWTGSAFNVRGPDGSITISSGVVDWDKINAKPEPTSFLESFQSGDLTQWTNHDGSGELSIVSVSDSLTGGKVLRIGNNSGDDQAWLIHNQNIPFDPSALYRIKFRVRRTAGTGTVYLGVAGVAADGTTWVRANGANSINGQHYVAANGQNPGTAWTEYVGYVKGTAATGQSGTNPPVTVPLKLHQNVRYIRPLIVANYDDVAGITEVDYCSIELMTDAMSWDVISGTGKPEDGATVGAPAGTLVAGVQAANVAAAVTDFNASNNRNGAAITAPTILTNGTAVYHVAQKDGSVDISFEWAWGGNEGDIDGFLVFVRQSASATAYTFGKTPAEETVYTVPANKRAFVLFGVAADKYYTFGVQAYRAVDKAINAAGVIKSTLVKATGSGENPYRPSANVAFLGDVTGTIDGTLASTLVTNASTALSNANAAQADATDALDALADIAADNKLTPAEKKSVRKEWDQIYAERAGIRAQADLFDTPPDNGIATAKANYDSDFQTLGTYLNGGVAYTIGTNPPSWIKDENLSATTSITGTTFRNHWKNLYADRQALLNKIAVETSKRADWTLTAGKPDDEDILNAGHPLNKNPDLNGAVANADSAPGWSRVISSDPAFAGIRIEAAGSTYGPPWDREAPMFYANIADTANAANEYAYWYSETFRIDTSKPHCLSGWARKMWSAGTPNVYFRVRCYDKDGVSLGYISRYSGYTGLTTTWAQMVKKIEPVDWPAGTYKVRIEWYGAYQQHGSSVATRLMLNEGRVPTRNLAPPIVDIDAHLTRNGTSVLANDFVATWNKISSSNILTYMGPTAITAAVIGTAAIETAKIKDGAITTAKIGDLEVDTIKLANQAVTIPSGAYTASATALSTTYKTVQTVTYTSSGAPVIIICSCVVGAGSLVGVNARITRNGTPLYDAWTISVGQSAGAYASCVVTIRDTLTTSGPRTYNFDISYQSFASGDATARSMVVLEVKK